MKTENRDATSTLLMDKLVELSKTKPLRKITLSELLSEAGVSRSAFTKRFLDMQDVINSILSTRIIHNSWEGMTTSKDDYYLACVISFRRMLAYKEFILQAFKMDGQNNMFSYLTELSYENELGLLARMPGLELSEEDRMFFAHYHSEGCSSAVRFWLEQKENQLSTETFAASITEARFGALKGLIDKS